MIRLAALLRFTPLFLLTLLISACGGTGGSETPREDPPPRDDFILNVAGELSAEQVGHRTHLAGTWLQINGVDDISLAVPAETMTGNLAAGSFEVSFDARDFGHVTTPELYGGFLLAWQETPDVTDPDAELKILQGVSLNQTDTDSERTLPSHVIVYRTDSGRPLIPVWSDRSTEITASNDSVVLDITFEAGWNFLESEFEGSVQTYSARPARRTDTPMVERSVPWRALGTVSGVEAAALYMANRDAAGEPLEALATQLTRVDGSLFLTAPNWLTPSEADKYLTNLATALGTAPANVTSEGSARFALGRYLGFTDAAGDWWDNPDSSSGEIFPVVDRNRLVLLYADRSAAVTFTGVNLAGGAAATAESGIELRFGWNLLELTPDPAGGDGNYLAVPYSGSSPSQLETVIAGSDTLLLDFELHDEYELGPDTRLRWTTLRSESDSLYLDSAGYREQPVGPDGHVSWTVKAESISGSFRAEVYAARYFHQPAGAAPEFAVSEPGAQLKMITDAHVAQYSPLGEQRLASHRVFVRHDYATDAGNRSSFMDLVHSDRAVSINAGYQGIRSPVDVQVDLVPGWNLVYSETRNVGGMDVIAYRARVAHRNARVELRFSSTELAHGDVADPVAIVALYAAHQVSGAAPDVYPLLWVFSAVDNPGKGVSGPAWVPPYDGQDLLVSPLEAFEFAVEGDITSSATELGIVVADVRTFDESHRDILNVTPTGRIDTVTAAEGNPVVFIYADRQATVQVDGLVINETGATVATSGTGLSLSFGWNTLELRPAGAGAATDFMLEPLAPGAPLLLNHSLY